MKKVDGLGGLTANGVTIKVSHIFQDIQPNFELDISIYRYVTLLQARYSIIILGSKP